MYTKKVYLKKHYLTANFGIQVATFGEGKSKLSQVVDMISG